MNSENPMHTQVVVVGAGPVGLMLAGELRLGGADVIVLERLLIPISESRASQLNARTMEIFDQRGLLERMERPQWESGGHFGGLSFDVSGQPSPYAGHWKIPQPRTEAMLQGWAGELGADIRRGHELRGLTVRPDHVVLEVVGPDGPTTVRAHCVVGCDGEQSMVRRLAGFELAGKDASLELLRADVSGIEIPDRRFQRYDRGLAISASRAGVTRVMMHEFGGHAVKREEPPAFDEIVGTWTRITGEDISAGTPIWVDAFNNASKQVTQYRKGRILLAGDAAHIQMPVGGQALNLGLQDAANLGWKLAAKVRGFGTDELLDSYHDERHPVGARVLTNVEAQALLLLGGPEVEAARKVFEELLQLDDCRSHLAALVSGLDIRYEVGEGDHPLLGVRIPPCDLTTTSGDSSDSSSTTQLLHSGRGVLLVLSTGFSDQVKLHRAVEGWADRVDLITAEVTADSALAGIDAVLLRPDGHAAWIGPGSGDLDKALHRWFGDPSVARS
jgi:oxygenase